jgi:hypothetical protein
LQLLLNLPTLNSKSAVESTLTEIRLHARESGPLSKWLAHKDKYPFLWPCLCQPLSGMDRNTWFSTAFTTNPGEGAHRTNNLYGTNLTLTEAVRTSQQIDLNMLRKTGIIRDTGTAVHYTDQSIIVKFTSNIKRQGKCREKAQEKSKQGVHSLTEQIHQDGLQEELRRNGSPELSGKDTSTHIAEHADSSSTEELLIPTLSGPSLRSRLLITKVPSQSSVGGGIGSSARGESESGSARDTGLESSNGGGLRQTQSTRGGRTRSSRSLFESSTLDDSARGVSGHSTKDHGGLSARDTIPSINDKQTEVGISGKPVISGEQSTIGKRAVNLEARTKDLLQQIEANQEQIAQDRGDLNRISILKLYDN